VKGRFVPFGPFLAGGGVAVLLIGLPGPGAGWVGPEPPGRRVRRIGLTGGIGSGKSSVARVLVDCGAVLVDTDAIARSLTCPGGAAIPPSPRPSAPT
jgi:hypothetical protein